MFLTIFVIYFILVSFLILGIYAYTRKKHLNNEKFKKEFAKYGLIYGVGFSFIYLFICFYILNNKYR